MKSIFQQIHDVPSATLEARTMAERVVRIQIAGGFGLPTVAPTGNNGVQLRYESGGQTLTIGPEGYMELAEYKK